MENTPNPLLLRGGVMGYKSMMIKAIKPIPPQPSLTSKGGSNQGNSPLLVRGKTRWINSSLLRSYNTVSRRGGKRMITKLLLSPSFKRGIKGVFSGFQYILYSLICCNYYGNTTILRHSYHSRFISNICLCL
jgi:hypothetical protein